MRARFTGTNAAKIAEFLGSEAQALYEYGRDRGSNVHLVAAIALRREQLALAGSADERGVALNNLGNALLGLGERESGTARLEEAVQAYRAALEERTRERVPLDWAATQNNLGNALSRLGERESGTARLEEAVAGLSRGAGGKDARAGSARLGDDAEQSRQCALSARRAGERDGAARGGGRRPIARRWRKGRASGFRFDWAATQNNLGIALTSARRAGERDGAARGGGRRLSRGAGGMRRASGFRSTGR